MRNVLIMISSDPRSSQRPAEAIRLAAGLAQWPRINVRVYLRDAAVLALSGEPDDLMDGEFFRDCLPLVAKPETPIYVQHLSPTVREIGHSAVRFLEISDDQLAREIARSHYVLRF